MSAFKLPPLRFTAQVFFTSFLACFPAYHFAVVNVAANVYKEFINETFTHTYGTNLTSSGQTIVFSFLVSSYNLGGLFGSLSVGFLAERWGRKNVLMIGNNIASIVACSLMAGSWAAGSFSMFIIGRLLIGYSTSLAYGMLVLYLSEIGPTHLRGFSSSSLNLMLSLNSLLTLALALPQCLGSRRLWVILQGAPAPFALIQILASPLFPDTPKHLLLKKRNRKAAKKAYRFFDTHATKSEVRKLFLHYEAERKQAVESVGLGEALRRPHIRTPLAISILCQIAAVTAGIVVIFSYSTGLFEKIGFSRTSAQNFSILMSAFNTLGAVAANQLMDRVGRRVLMLGGLFCTASACLLFMISSLITPLVHSSWPAYLGIVVIFFHVTVYNIGPGAIAWFICAEMTPQSARALTTGLVVTVGGLSQVITNFSFPPLQDRIGPYVFLTLVIPTLVATGILYFVLPETKNKPVDEIVARWKKTDNEDPEQITHAANDGKNSKF